MKALTNPSVEPPARLFTVSFVALGTIIRPAILRRVQVLDATRAELAERRARAEHLEVACRDGQHRHSNRLAASREVSRSSTRWTGSRYRPSS